MNIFICNKVYNRLSPSKDLLKMLIFMQNLSICNFSSVIFSVTSHSVSTKVIVKHWVQIFSDLNAPAFWRCTVYTFDFNTILEYYVSWQVQWKLRWVHKIAAHCNVCYLFINTSYLTESCIVFTLKMESVSENTIFGLKMMVKSGLENFILKSLHAGR